MSEHKFDIDDDLESEVVRRANHIGSPNYRKDTFYFELRMLIKDDRISFQRKKDILDGDLWQIRQDTELLMIRAYLFWLNEQRCDCLDEILDYTPSWKDELYPKVRKRIREEQRNNEWTRSKKLLTFYNGLATDDQGKAVYTDVEMKLFNNQDNHHLVKPQLPPERDSTQTSTAEVAEISLPYENKYEPYNNVVLLNDNVLLCMGKSGTLFAYNYAKQSLEWTTQFELGLKHLQVDEDYIAVCCAKSRGGYESSLHILDKHGNVLQSKQTSDEYWKKSFTTSNKILVSGRTTDRDQFIDLYSREDLSKDKRINESLYTADSTNDVIALSTLDNHIYLITDKTTQIPVQDDELIKSVLLRDDGLYYAQRQTVCKHGWTNVTKPTTQTFSLPSDYIHQLVPQEDHILAFAQHTALTITPDLKEESRISTKGNYSPLDPQAQLSWGDDGVTIVEPADEMNPTARIEWNNQDITFPTSPHNLLIMNRQTNLVAKWGKRKDYTVKIAEPENETTISNLKTPSYFETTTHWLLIDQDTLYTKKLETLPSTNKATGNPSIPTKALPTTEQTNSKQGIQSQPTQEGQKDTTEEKTESKHEEDTELSSIQDEQPSSSQTYFKSDNLLPLLLLAIAILLIPFDPQSSAIFIAAGILIWSDIEQKLQAQTTLNVRWIIIGVSIVAALL